MTMKTVEAGLFVVLVIILALAHSACGGNPPVEDDAWPRYTVTVAVSQDEGPLMGSLRAQVPNYAVSEPPLVSVLEHQALQQGSAWQLTEAQMRAVLTEAGWPHHLHEWALAITWRESRWSPWAVNWGDQADGLGSTGLWQMWSGWYAFAGESYADWRDPVVNSRVAWKVYQYDLAHGQPGHQWRTE